MKNMLCILLLLIIGILPVAAQDEQCVEYGSFDYVNNVSLKHQINLETGAVVTSPQPAESNVTPDVLFTATLEQYESYENIYSLILTDNHRGISIVLAPTVTTDEPHWSPDGLWLAYIETDVSQDINSISLFNTETGQVISSPLIGERIIAGYPDLIWSPDSRFIAVILFVDPNVREQPAELQVYSVPDLAHRGTYPLDANAYLTEVYWSPTENYFVIDQYDGGDWIVDTASWEMYTLNVQGIDPMNNVSWSPDEAYVAVRAYLDTTYDNFAVINMQGEAVIDTLLINRLGQVYWIDNNRLLLPTDDEQTRSQNGYDLDYDLTLFDLQTGEQHLVIENAISYRLSSDHRYLVEISNTEQFIKIYDLSQSEAFLIDDVAVDEIMFQYLWREDQLELIVLFEDMSLRAYDLETQTWRTIATDIPHPGDDAGIYQAVCAA